MSERDQEKIDALFMGYLDGELNERERTELKRLLQTYPALESELEELRRQKDLLGALPRAKAPATLAADVQAALERNLILGSKEVREQSRWDAVLLLVRRIAAVAAMLLIPVGVLGILVFQIMRPAEPMPGDPEPLGRQMKFDESPLPGLASGTIDASGRPAVRSAGRLVLLTDQPILVNRFIEKRIHLNRLLNEAMPEREAEKTVYGIECTAGQLARFIEDLAGVWPRCSDACYTLIGEDSQSPVVVGRIRPEQLAALMRETNADQRRRDAVAFARANQQPGDRSASPAVEAITPPQPVTAWDATVEEPVPALEEGPKVRFTLEVHRADLN